MSASLLITIREACRRLSRSRSSLELDVKDGRMPAPQMFGRNRVWASVEIDAIAAAVANGADENALRNLTQEIIQTRQLRADAARSALLGTSKD